MIIKINKPDHGSLLIIYLQFLAPPLIEILAFQFQVQYLAYTERSSAVLICDYDCKYRFETQKGGMD